MKQRVAFDATIELARTRGMFRVRPEHDASLGWDHLLSMQGCGGVWRCDARGDESHQPPVCARRQ